MKEKILQLLQAKFAGERKDGLEQLARVLALQATTDDEATALVDKLNDKQVGEMIKEYRSEVDKEKTAAQKTFEDNLRKKYDFVEKSATPPSDPPKSDEPKDMAEAIKAAVAEALKPIHTELANYKAGDVAKSRLQSLNDKLSTCKDDAFKERVSRDFGRMQFETDEDFAGYLADMEKDIEFANQRITDNEFGQAGRPLFSQKAESGVSSAVASYVKEKEAGGTSLGGKEV